MSAHRPGAVIHVLRESLPAGIGARPADLIIGLMAIMILAITLEWLRSALRRQPIWLSVQSLMGSLLSSPLLLSAEVICRN